MGLVRTGLEAIRAEVKTLTPRPDDIVVFRVSDEITPEVFKALHETVPDGVGVVVCESGSDADVDVLKLGSEQGANITYLRVMARSGDLPHHVADQVERACDDIAAYREICGLVLSGDDPDRLKTLVAAMTWSPGEGAS